MKILPLLCLLLILSAPVLGQEPDSLLFFELEEVVVTARRGGGDILQLPMAVSVIGPMAAVRGAGLKDVLQTVPGVLVQSRSGSQDVRLTIRGFGARGNGDRSNAATIRGIKVLVDGVPETDPDGRTALDLIDVSMVERVEVLRTNASTLFGNASGGVVNFETVQWFSEPTILSRAAGGSYGLRQGKLQLGIPLEGGSASFSLTTSSFRGWRKNSEHASTRAAVALRTISGRQTRLTVQALAADNRFSIPGPLTQVQFEADPAQASTLYQLRRERRNNQIGRISLQAAQTWNPNHTTEILGFFSPKVLQRSERNTFRDFSRFHLGGGAVHTWKPGDSFFESITAGFDQSYQDGTILFYDLKNGERGDSLRSNKREAAGALGVFTQIQMRLSAEVIGILGARFDLQQYRSSVFPAGRQQPTRDDRTVFRHVTPRFALLWRVSPDHSLYLNVGGGLEFPAFNEVDPPASLPDADLNPFLKPMTSTTIEVGLKGTRRFSGAAVLRSYSYSVAAYHISIRNEIVPFNGGAWFFSSGASRRVGIETGGTVEWDFGLSLQAAVTVMDAVHRAYQTDIGDFSGRQVAGIPRLFFTTRARYQLAQMFFELSREHVGSYFADDANTLSVPAFTLWNLTAGVQINLGWVSGSLFGGVQNLADVRYTSSAFINPVGSPQSAAFLEPGLPRNFFAGFDLRAIL